MLSILQKHLQKASHEFSTKIRLIQSIHTNLVLEKISKKFTIFPMSETHLTAASSDITSISMLRKVLPLVHTQNPRIMQPREDS